MIHKLDKKDFHKVIPLFQNLDYHLAIFSVIKNNSPGDIYVDNPDAPTIAFAWDKTEGGYYLSGDPGNNFAVDINNIIKGPVLEEAKTIQHCVDFTFNYSPESWEQYIDTIFADYPVLRHERKYFEINTPLPVSGETLPGDFRFVNIDKDFLAQEKMKNMGDIEGWIRTNWRTPENFLEKGFGFCIIQSETIVSWSLADYIVGKQVEIGIHTDKEYRKQGFATKLVKHVTAYAFSHKFERIGWHCWSGNTASTATALKAGFKKILDHPVYHRWHNSFDNLLVPAHFFYERDLYKESITAYEKAFAAMVPDNTDFNESKIYSNDKSCWFLFYAARSASLAGNKTKAIKFLEKAVAGGFKHFNLLAENEAFTGLKDDPGFQKLLKMVRD